MITGVVMYAAFWLAIQQITTFSWLLLVIPLTLLMFVRELYTGSEKPYQNIGATITGVVYVFSPLILSLWIAYGFTPGDNVAYHGRVVMGVIFLVWASDTGAYFTGSKFGKHRLFERISPRKSWEGFFGGMLFAALTAWILSMFYTELSMTHWLVASIIVTVTGTLGDLAESMLKRSAGVKDSGNILPGHGGILDRFDAFFMALPFVFCYLYATGHFS
jgi:phosphatidate cytidylyltransferase